ncbi:MAG TPA: anti-sigma factor [Devosiaceae bacterium]|nr:anti-sigma factor [Devosiaceae bacterium]
MSVDGEQGGGEDGDRVRVAEFALGLLPAQEHEALARRLATEPALARELALWRRRFSGLDSEFAEVTPPAGVLERVEARVFPQPAARSSGLWNSLGFWRGLAATCFALAIVAGGFALAPRPPLTGQELVAALEAEGSNIKFVAFYDEAAGMVRIAALSGDAAPNKDFELWAIHGTSPPVSMGVIPVGSKSDIAVPAAMRPGFVAGTVLAVTLEPKGGSPSGAPTGPVVAKGATTAI